MLSLILPPIILVLALAFLVFFFSRHLPALEARIRERQSADVPGTASFWERVRDSVRHTFWHVMEKTVRKFKLVLLKAHNSFNSLSDAARRRREASRGRLERFRNKPTDAGISARPVPDDAPSTGTVGSGPSQGTETGRRRFMDRVFGLKDQGPASGPISDGPSRSDPPEPMERRADIVEPKTADNTEAVVSEGETVIQEDPSPERPFVRRRRAVVKDDMADRTAPSLVLSQPERPHTSAVPTVPTEAEQEPKKKDQFEEILIERIVSNPRDVEAYERLGDYYLEHDNLVDAKECYRQVLKLSPVNRLVKIKIRRLEKILGKGK